MADPSGTISPGGPAVSEPTLHLPPEHRRAAAILDELMEQVKIDYAFVGSIALNAWLDVPVAGSLDLLALISPERGSQLPMMATQRGFRVDREEMEAVKELDLLPMHFEGEQEIRVNVLMATNALYSNMIARRREVSINDDRTVWIIAPADLALLLRVAEDETSAGQFTNLLERQASEVDVEKFNRNLRSIGLSRLEVAR